MNFCQLLLCIITTGQALCTSIAMLELPRQVPHISKYSHLHCLISSYALCRQLSAVKSNMASVDHLKEIERLKGALTAAEGNIKTLTAQLTSKEMGEW